MRALYNDTERFACDWLQHLMDAGLIMPGKIDDRSIADLSPDDLAGFERVHLFAGIAGWDLALQLANWPAGKPVWTCSCPCPPFSQAGKRQRCPGCESANLVWCPRRTGYCICADCSHAWLADARHLWPEAWRLIARCRPPVVFGEQVASPDGLGWLAGVRASLEILSYAPWGTDYPAAGVGSPNIRQRIFWLGESDGGGSQAGQLAAEAARYRCAAGANGGAHGLADARHGARRDSAELSGTPRTDEASPPGQRWDGIDWTAAHRGATGRLADSGEPRRSEQPGRDGGEDGRSAPQSGRLRDFGGMEHAEGQRPGRREGERRQEGRGVEHSSQPHRLVDAEHRGRKGRHEEPRRADPALPSGPWNKFDIVHCTDGKARRVPQSSLLRLADGLSSGMVRGGFEGAEGFPLAEGAGNRVGRLRGYGNSINPYAAAEFIRAWREVREA